MRVLVAHNRYQFAGGEDSVVRVETAMLRERGHSVELLEADNHAIANTRTKLLAVASLFGSSESYARMRERIDVFRPDVVHLHNWFPLLSPSVVRAAADAHVPVVHTLHNFRMVCAGGSLYRDGTVCHQCVGKSLPLGPIAHGCYRGSRTGSAAVSAAFAYHRAAGTWDGVTTFIALTEFQRDLLVQGGVDAKRLVIKPNFARDRGGAGRGDGGYALFVGRLTQEKGIRTALDAWEKHDIGVPLRIMGDGPLADEVQQRASVLRRIEYLGQRSPEEVDAAMANALCLVFPSVCYEPFALTIIEAFARGTPVVAARLDSILGLVREAETGYTFPPGDESALADAIRGLHENVEAQQTMRATCRAFYESSYTEETNYRLLMQVYDDAAKQMRTTRASADVLGVRVDAVNMQHALACMADAVRLRRKGYVCLAGAHGVMEARRDTALQQIFEQAALVLPDGMPAVWIGRLQGFRTMDRVFGPELMQRVFASGAFEGARHFFCGGQDGVARQLAAEMQRRFPSSIVCGAFTPPFRAMTEEEERNFEQCVAEARPDIVWVGLSTPKQERFMASYLPRLNTTLMVGVGAAFLYHTGSIADSPRWVKRAGLQWLHRLFQEPRRLWRRYLSVVPAFFCLALVQLFTRARSRRGRPACG